MSHYVTQLARALVLLILVVSLAACTSEQEPAPAGEEESMPVNSLELTSAAFDDGSAIPAEYTCDGADVSPPLSWSGAPEGVGSYALIMDDPDATSGTWVHWVLYDLPAETSALPQDAPADAGVQGHNSWNRTGYGGPCPPSGEHRYLFKLYALDALLDLAEGATKEELLQAMEGHVLAQSELMGSYSR